MCLSTCVWQSKADTLFKDIKALCIYLVASAIDVHFGKVYGKGFSIISVL